MYDLLNPPITHDSGKGLRTNTQNVLVVTRVKLGPGFPYSLRALHSRCHDAEQLRIACREPGYVFGG